MCYIFVIHLHTDTTYMLMNAVTERKQTAFRLDASLLERLKAEARREHRSLNNVVEVLLYEALENRPNPETIEAIEEARSGKKLEKLDLNRFEEYVSSL